MALETSSRGAPAPFPKELIGFHRFASAAKINQDRGVIQYPLADDDHQMLLAVYDGHGQHGEHCSEFAAYECIELLESNPESLRHDPKGTLFKQVVEVDQRLRKKRDIPSHESGTTAIICILRPDRVWTACVGDSRAVMGRETTPGGAWDAIDLSTDQKPDLPCERERIEAAGGFVSLSSDEFGPSRVWRYSYGLGPGLAMARSIGDHAVAEIGVFAEPEITEFEVTEADKCIVLGSDGLWEFVSSKEAIEIVQKYSQNSTAACKALIAEASARWKKEEGNYRDDITAIVCRLPAIAPLAQLASTKGSSSAKTKAEFDGDLEGRGKVETADQRVAPPDTAMTAEDDLAGIKPSFTRRRLSVATVEH